MGGGDQMRTLQDLAKKDMTVNGKYTNVYYSGFVTMYGNYAAVWHDLMVECFDNTGGCKDKPDDFKKYIINKGSIGIVTAYVTYEMGAAVWKAADGNLDDDGAAYAWDLGWWHPESPEHAMAWQPGFSGGAGVPGGGCPDTF